MTTSKLTDPLLPTSSPQETEAQRPEVLARNGSNGSSVAAGSANTEMTSWSSFVNGLYSGASNLGNLLPTGTFLTFTAIAPIITGNGTCDDAFEFYLTITVLVFFALFCACSCFTDSYQAADGKVYYGLVTVKGLWTPQLPEALHPGDKEQYKVTLTDVIHSVLSVAVFSACALVTPNISACFYPNIPENVVRIVPAVVGFFVSSAFVTFPSKRHGVGFPVSPSSSSASKSITIQQKSDPQAGSEDINGVAASRST